MKTRYVLAVSGLLLLALGACSANKGGNESGAGRGNGSGNGGSSGPVEEAYEPTDRCSIDGHLLIADDQKVYDETHDFSTDITGSALSKYNILKHVGACKTGNAPRCRMDNYYILYEGKQVWGQVNGGKKVKHYAELIAAGACDYATTERCSIDGHDRILFDGIEAFNIPDTSEKLDFYKKMVKVGACVKANSKHCTTVGTAIKVDGSTVYENADDHVRLNKLIEMVQNNQCK